MIAQAQATADAGIEGTDDIAESALAVLSFASTLMIGGLVVATIIGIVLAIFLTRSITGPIRRIIDGMSEGSQEVASAAGQVSSARPSRWPRARASRRPRSRRPPRRWRRCPR